MHCHGGDAAKAQAFWAGVGTLKTKWGGEINMRPELVNIAGDERGNAKKGGDTSPEKSPSGKCVSKKKCKTFFSLVLMFPSPLVG